MGLKPWRFSSRDRYIHYCSTLGPSRKLYFAWSALFSSRFFLRAAALLQSPAVCSTSKLSTKRAFSPFQGAYLTSAAALTPVPSIGRKNCSRWRGSRAAYGRLAHQPVLRSLFWLTGSRGELAAMVLRLPCVAACLAGLCFVATAGPSESVWTSKGGDVRPVALTVSKSVLMCLEETHRLPAKLSSSNTKNTKIASGSQTWSTPRQTRNRHVWKRQQKVAAVVTDTAMVLLFCSAFAVLWVKNYW